MEIGDNEVIYVAYKIDLTQSLNMIKKRTKSALGMATGGQCKSFYFFVTKKTVKKYGNWDLPTDIYTTYLYLCFSGDTKNELIKLGEEEAFYYSGEADDKFEKYDKELKQLRADAVRVSQELKNKVVTTVQKIQSQTNIDTPEQQVAMIKGIRELKRRREILLAISVGLNIISMVIAAILFYSYFSVQKEKPSGCSVS